MPCALTMGLPLTLEVLKRFLSCHVCWPSQGAKHMKSKDVDLYVFTITCIRVWYANFKLFNQTLAPEIDRQKMIKY